MKTSKQALMSAINLYSEYFLGFVISLAVARNLSTDDYGVYSSIIWIAAFISLSVNSGVSISSIKFFAEYKQNNPSYLGHLYQYFRNLQLKRMLMVVVFMAGLLWSQLVTFDVSVVLILVLIVCALAKSDYMFRTAIFKGTKRFDIVAKTSFFANIANLTLVISVAYFMPSLENFVLVYCLSCIFYFLSSNYYNKYLPPRQIDTLIPDGEFNTLKQQVFYAAIIIFIGFFLMKQSQVIFLEANNFKTEAGFFNIAFLLSTAAISLVPGVYQEILLPKISGYQDVSDIQAQIKLSENILIILALMAALPVLYFAQDILVILYGERYIDAAIILQALMVIKIVQLLIQGPNLTLIKHNSQKERAKVNGLVLLIGVITSLLLVPMFGLVASVWIYGACIILILIGYIYYAQAFSYRLFSVKRLVQITCLALIASVPMLLPSMYYNNVIAIGVSSICFWLLYFALICRFKLIDKALSPFLNRLGNTSPKPIGAYFHYCSKALATS